MKINLNFKPIPSVLYIKGEKYTGEIVFINGYNGYSTTPEDSMLCGIQNNSAFDNGEPIILSDKEGNVFYSTNRRGQFYKTP